MRFRKNPLIIEAMQFNGLNYNEIFLWANTISDDTPPMNHYRGSPPEPEASFIEIETLEGIMTADKDDWIICGIEGEFYPCKPGIFEKTHEPVNEETTQKTEPE